MSDRIPADAPPRPAAVVPPAEVGGGGARTVSSGTGTGGAERRVSENCNVGSPGAGHGGSNGGLPRPSPAAHAAGVGVGVGVGVAVGVAVAAGGRPTSAETGSNYLVSETEDNWEADGPRAAAAAASTSTSTSTNQEGTPTAIPQEDEAAAAEEVDDDQEATKDGDDDGDDEEEESDYSYEYDDEDDHYGGFLVEAAHPPSAVPHAVSAPASADGDHAAAAAAAGSGGGGVGVGGAEEAAGNGNSSSSSGGAAAASAASGAAAANGGSGSLLAPVSLAPPRPSRSKKWRDPSREAVNMSLRAEKETTGGKRRLASDLYKIMMNDTGEAGYDIEPKSEDSMDAWTIRLFGFDTDSNLHQDMLVLGLDHIELEMRFPDQYPFAPPFVRVVRPRFKRQTGFVMNGALCMELLTADGWNPVNDIESVIVSIRSLLVVGDGRLEAAVNLGPEKRRARLAEAEARLEKKKSGASGEDDDDDDGNDDDDDASDEGSRKRPRDSDASDGADSKKKAKGEEEGDGDGGGGNDDGKKSGSAISKTAAGSYSTAEAKSAYQHLTDFHKKKGWDSSGWWSRRG